MKYTNEDSRAEDGGPASTKRPIEDNRQCFVGNDITQEQRNEDPMFAVLEQSQHPLRGLALVGFARGS